MDRLTSMRVFVEVVQRGSLRAAADVLQLSPTMVGKHIAALEAQLGVRLLNRTTRRQALTDAGRLWLDDSRAILAGIADAEAAVSDLRGRPRGLLRVDAPVTFGVHDLTPALVDFMAQNPEIEIDLRLNNRVVDLLGEGVDVVFRIGPLADSSLLARPLRAYRMALAAAPAYLRDRGEPSEPDDLAGHDCLGFAYWSQRTMWTLSRDGLSRSVEVHSRFLTDNGEALRKAALSGGGVIMQPETLIREDLENGNLIRVLPGWNAPSRAMHVLYPADRRPAAKVQAFLSFVMHRFR